MDSEGRTVDTESRTPMNDSSTSRAPRVSADPTEPAQHIAELRANLLGGRGPGASQQELEAHQHQRIDYGGMPITVVRERDSLVAARARAEPVDAPRVDAARRIAQWAVTPASEANRHRTPRGPRSQRTDVASALALGALIGFAVAFRRRR